jgi:hypothetical protein
METGPDRGARRLRVDNNPYSGIPCPRQTRHFELRLVFFGVGAFLTFQPFSLA